MSRWVTSEEMVELVHLFHLARGYLAGGYAADRSRGAKVRLAARWFAKDNPQHSATAVYKDLDGHLMRGEWQ